jgi:hypothetical protein
VYLCALRVLRMNLAVQEVVVVNTGRGYKLYDGRGFAYHRDHTRQDKSYWRCELNLRSNKELKCRARVMTAQDGSVVYNGTPHNHTPIYSSQGKAMCTAKTAGVRQGCSCRGMVSGLLKWKACNKSFTDFAPGSCENVSLFSVQHPNCPNFRRR